MAEYLEGPYRILRKDGTAATRVAITGKLSDVKTATDYNQALLRLHADPGVADAFDAYVKVAKHEAGEQMPEAWKADPVITDDGVNLHVPLPRGDSEAARTRLLDVMQGDLAHRWYNPNSHRRYNTAVTTVIAATTTSANAASAATQQDTQPDRAASARAEQPIPTPINLELSGGPWRRASSGRSCKTWLVVKTGSRLAVLRRVLAGAGGPRPAA